MSLNVQSIIFYPQKKSCFQEFWSFNPHLNLPDGYGSIPLNTIFRGMNIHKSQLF